MGPPPFRSPSACAASRAAATRASSTRLPAPTPPSAASTRRGAPPSRRSPSPAPAATTSWRIRSRSGPTSTPRAARGSEDHGIITRLPPLPDPSRRTPMPSCSRSLARRRLAAFLVSASTSLGALAALGGPVPALADPAPNAPTPDANRVYEQIRLTLPTPEDALRLLREVSEIEFVKPEPGQTGTYTAVSRPDLDEKIRALGYSVEVLVPDLVAAFESSPTAGPGFGVFHTYSETEAYLDSIAAAFPAITTEKFSIGNTLQGRTIWAIKVSDNPDIDEDEGEVLFDGTIHAREIMTVEMCLDYLNYLCSNYGTDPLATFLVNNRELYFVPIINADGFVYNEQTNPNGGGMWRKNRNPNGGGCVGVDNNRNYSLGWGGINGDPDPCSEQYRGVAPNSEPENQVMEAFINSRHFVTHQALHSYAGLVLLPWGYDNTIHAPDDSLLRVIGQEMARDSGYLVGQAGDVLYNAAGNAFDWSYAETTHPSNIFAYTMRMSGSGFWPQPREASGLLAENLHAHIYRTQIAGAYPTVAGSSISGENGNGRLEPGESA